MNSRQRVPAAQTDSLCGACARFLRQPGHAWGSRTGYHLIAVAMVRHGIARSHATRHLPSVKLAHRLPQPQNIRRRKHPHPRPRLPSPSPWLREDTSHFLAMVLALGDSELAADSAISAFGSGRARRTDHDDHA